MKRNRKVSLIPVVLLLSCIISSSIYASADDTQFLAKPTGTYGIGFQDIHFQDNNRCPDPDYNLGSAHDFSPENTNHCREILVRVYYPTNQPVSLGSAYYAPQITFFEDFLNFYVSQEAPFLLPLDFHELAALKSYAHENDRPATVEKFPVILFGSGAGSPVQVYENVITNLASHGYVVVAVNSIFSSGYNALPNGHVVKTDYTNSEEEIQQATVARTTDVLYVKNHLDDIDKNLANIMDETNVGIMGHSQGANAIVKIMKSHNEKYFKAAIAMDADAEEIFPSFAKPFLHELSGQRYWTAQHTLTPKIAMPKYILNKNNYVVGIVPSLNDLIHLPSVTHLYSIHGSFTDWSTLQYTSAFQAMVPAFDKLNPIMFKSNSPGYEWGTGNGFAVSHTINIYTLKFFDIYLKRKSDQQFSNCEKLTPNSIISCGPTVFPYNNSNKGQ